MFRHYGDESTRLFDHDGNNILTFHRAWSDRLAVNGMFANSFGPPNPGKCIRTDNLGHPRSYEPPPRLMNQ